MAQTDEIKMPLTSADLLGERIEGLRELFPEVFTEGRIDVERLKLALGEHTADGPERYGLTWPGKADAVRAIQTPSSGTLVPMPAESVNFDTSENLIIEGDNLEVLKLLQKSYHGKVKMIYIDPPYNTGNEFIYPDNFREGLPEYLRWSGQTDENGARRSTNMETGGRYHSIWLSMMYPRLFLARNLLTPDGMLMVSISDIEMPNLRRVLDEIFGEENFLASLIWVNEGNIDNQSRFKRNHEYILLYARDEYLIEAPPVIDPNIPPNSKLHRDYIENTIIKNGPANPISDILLPIGFPATFSSGLIRPQKDFWPKLSNDVRIHDHKTQNPVVASSGWSSRDIVDKYIEQGFQPVVDSKGQESTFAITESGAIYARKRRLESQSHVLTVLRSMGTVQGASRSLAEIGIEFSYPKPEALLEYLIRIGSESDSIIMDFFAGSGGTGNAVLNLNQKDSGQRKFILVQLPEPYDNDGFATIADICRERVRRVIQKQSEAGTFHNGGGSAGFRAFKLTSSNFKIWNADETSAQPDALAKQLELYADHLLPDRSRQDVLYELILKFGLPLTVTIEPVEVGGGTAYTVDGDNLLVCLEPRLDEAMLRAAIALNPVRVVCLDGAFQGNDQLKTNTALEMKSHDIDFRTV